MHTREDDHLGSPAGEKSIDGVQEKNAIRKTNLRCAELWREEPLEQPAPEHRQDRSGQDSQDFEGAGNRSQVTGSYWRWEVRARRTTRAQVDG